MPQEITLGVDLDGVCLDYTEAFRQYTAKVLGVDPSTLTDPSSYSFFESGWGFASEDHFRLIHGQAVDDGLYETLPVMPGVSESLHRISKKGYYIRIVTSRFVNSGQHAKVVAQTAARLDSANIPYRELAFSRRKWDIRNDVMIDDAPNNVIELRKAGIDTIVFEAPYNQHIDGPRAYTWADVETYLDNKFGLGL